MSEQAATNSAESEVFSEVEMSPPKDIDKDAPSSPTEAEAPGTDEGSKEPEYRNAEFEPLENEAGLESIEPNLDVILNIPVTLSMQIGKTRMTIEELMRLNRGSVVKLDRMAGEPMDVLVNGTLIAHGEVVVVNDKFGIRLLDVISPAERVKKLR
ncbi:flagellar motor switch protein FliN [Thiolapillus brandeum]|uniref:Flagellar motor switch protein FliN n=1 Tax=Thiolapillus brandeum TaxID=1076588 RepID=A0A7U6GIN8_9GAMM|nr:flagellar motor switch protein FliN [Thiolapillus brandeum]BAO44315.1 flagellar motor switch protein FliN/FliY: [Thiolapillus brandeum]